MNVGSTAGFVPEPLQAVYGASKAFVLSFTEALANELQGTGVSVTCLCPGVTDTRFYERGNVWNAKYAKTWKRMDAAKVAKVGYVALLKGRVMVIPGLMNSLGIFSFRFLPRKLATRIERSLA